MPAARLRRRAVGRRHGHLVRAPLRMLRAARVRCDWRHAARCGTAALQCLAHRRAFGQHFSWAERARRRRPAEHQLGRPGASPGFFPGEPAPDQAAHGLAGPARPCGAFREPSRPMSDSKPRRGEARRHTQDPGFGVKRGGVLGAKGCINGGAAKRFAAPQRPPVSTRGARRGQACANARCANV